MNALGRSGAIFAYQSSVCGHVHHVTVPDHKSLRLGTLTQILSDVADYLNIGRSNLAQELFDK
jgi:hypothetical protein